MSDGADSVDATAAAAGPPGAAEPSPTPPAQPAARRVVIVDDHALFRAGVRAELSGALDIVGEAASVEEADGIVHQVRPDVVLLDVHLPGGAGGGGAEVVARCQDLGGQTRFLAVSVSDAAEDVVQVIRAGARGYVTKSIGGAELIEAVERVAGGDAVFSPRLAGFVLDAFGAAGGDVATGDDELDRLTAREREVMRLIARGYTYKEAAAELFLSVKTIETHMSSVLRKLQLSNRGELTRWAAKRHFV
ncbi:MAG: response regulator transcription factor [Bifidobacteriaceae bacterium]|jgi:DNA-binding NarL/FixJ family response regulator|nr:response regulator transcription factor [Bifidobacteriaceae bacterium]